MSVIDEFEKQLNGTRNIFFGLLQGIDNSIKLDTPKYIYHYTSEENFKSIISSETLRLYTIKNFDDKCERKLKFPVENRISGKLTDNEINESFDITSLINQELSNDLIFIQSNTNSNKNKFLWNEYGKNQEGVCLKLSTEKYITYINSKIKDFDLLPAYYKCNYVSYDLYDFDNFLNVILNSLEKLPKELKDNLYPAWFFLLEYWRSFFKNNNFKVEQEIRFIISDHYALFLFICHLLIKWKVAKSSNPEEVSKLFLDEFYKRKNELYKCFNYNEDGKFVTIPLYEVLDTVIIGSESELTKNFISELTNNKIKKTNIKKSSKL